MIQYLNYLNTFSMVLISIAGILIGIGIYLPFTKNLIEDKGSKYTAATICFVIGTVYLIFC